MLRTNLRLIAASSLLVGLLAAPASPVVAGGGCHGGVGTAHTEGPSTVVKMELCAFVPIVVHVEPGTTVRFLNPGPLEHLVVGESQTWGTVDTLKPGDEYSRRFDDSGVFPFSCPLHPGMVGAVVVSGGGAPSVAPQAVAPVPLDPVSGAGPIAWAPVAALGIIVLAVALLAGGVRVRRQRSHVGLGARDG